MKPTIHTDRISSPDEPYTNIEKLCVLESFVTNVVERMISVMTIHNQSIHSATGFFPFSVIYDHYDQVYSDQKT